MKSYLLHSCLNIGLYIVVNSYVQGRLRVRQIFPFTHKEVSPTIKFVTKNNNGKFSDSLK